MIIAIADMRDFSITETEEMLSLLPRQRAAYCREKNEKDCRLSAVAYLLMKYAAEIALPNLVIGGIEHDGKGKPFIAGNLLYISLSHAGSYAAAAVSLSPVGLDIADYRAYNERIAERVCCENELSSLTRTEDKAKLFTRFWACKEAFYKNTGDGFRNGFKGFDATMTDERLFYTCERDFVLSAYGETGEPEIIYPKDRILNGLR